MPGWKLTCLICGLTSEELERDATLDPFHNPISKIQMHAAEVHGYTAFNCFREMTREELAPNHFRWTFPDGVAWLEGKKEETSDEELRQELKRRSDARMHARIGAWLDQKDHTLPEEESDLCISGCSWGTDGKFHHHPYCHLRASLRERKYYRKLYAPKEKR